ncbi:MAG: FeoC-like transcriptional regulator [Leptolyngbyaceae bacterium]|nr:FeoC-like transcriptional regulator [Leptolyngbyaceae bacterium]
MSSYSTTCSFIASSTDSPPLILYSITAYLLTPVSKMLRNIQAYIANHGTVSIADLGMHFHADRHTLTPMLSKLIRKGRIRQLPMSVKCAGCTCCDLSSLELYVWIDKGGDVKG